MSSAEKTTITEPRVHLRLWLLPLRRRRPVQARTTCPALREFCRYRCTMTYPCDKCGYNILHFHCFALNTNRFQKRLKQLTKQATTNSVICARLGCGKERYPWPIEIFNLQLYCRPALPARWDEMSLPRQPKGCTSYKIFNTTVSRTCSVLTKSGTHK